MAETNVVDDSQNANSANSATQESGTATEDTPGYKIRFTVQDGDKEYKKYLYSDDGKLRTKQEFVPALQHFLDTGNTPRGFAIYSPESLPRWMREKFESVNGPVQAGVKAVTSLPDMQNDTSEQLDQNTPEPWYQGDIAGKSFNSVINLLKNKALPFVADNVNTPQKALLTAALSGATPWINKGNLASSMLKSGVTALGADALYQGLLSGESQSSVDTQRKIIHTGMAALSAVGTQGLIGALRVALGKGLTQEGQQGVEKRLMESFQERFGGITYDPASLEALASTKSGASMLIQRGEDAFIGNASKMANGLLGDLQQVIKDKQMDSNTLGLIKPIIKDLTLAAQRYIKNDQPHLEQSLRQKVNAIGDELINQVQESIFNPRRLRSRSVSDAIESGRGAQSMLDNFGAALDDFKQGIQVFQIIKQSMDDKGNFNRFKFQELIRQKFLTQGEESFLADAGRAAFAGHNPLTSTGDTQLTTYGPRKVLEFLTNHRKIAQFLPLPRTVLESYMQPGSYSQRFMQPSNMLSGASLNVGTQSTLQSMDDFMSRNEK